MPAKFRVGVSPTSGRIYACQESKTCGSQIEGAFLVAGEKTDVTVEAIVAVGHHMLHDLPADTVGASYTFERDGKAYVLIVQPAGEPAAE